MALAPKYVKTLICLANSRKISGRCVAGKEFADGEAGDWVRPISTRDSGELSEEDRRFQDGKDPKVLDIIRVPMKEARPELFQTENHVIDNGYYWSRQGRATWDQVQAAVDEIEGPLWDNEQSSYYGLHDRVDESRAENLADSLKLVEVNDLKIKVGVEGAEFGNAKRKVRGEFSLNGHQYRLAVTDPVVERQYLGRANGTYDVGQSILCVSLGELFHGSAYKLIASVIAPPDDEDE